MTDNEKGVGQTPDFADQEFWGAFNQQLWLLVKEGRSADNRVSAEADVSDRVSLENSRKTNCLSFARYNEIAENPSTAGDAEKIHLQDCRYCERHINAFAALRSRSVQAASIPNAITKRNWSTWLVERFRVFGAISNGGGWLHGPLGKAALAGLTILLAGTVAFFLFQSRWLRPDQKASAPVGGPLNQGQNVQSPAQANLPNTNAKNLPSPTLRASDSATPPKTLVKKSEAEKNETLATPNHANEEQAVHLASESDLAALSLEDRRAVRESYEMEGIWLRGSDFESLTNNARRGLKDDQVTPIYPKNEATLETNPVFRWQGTGNQEYRIIVTYRGGEKVGASELLSQNSGQIRENLDPGIYYWRIAVRRHGEKEKIIPGFIIFKISSETEKRKVASAVAATRSNLVRAILYARAGFLGKAEVELKAELEKNPDSSTARKMLAQVQGWRMK